mmetsp:Transcript_67853/g.220927  ORF Transcript_67853/g.220927 Transcript_67853/m.220927 type:complete len:84 (+) Transcript_67853:1145-1396(+)
MGGIRVNAPCPGKREHIQHRFGRGIASPSAARLCADVELVAWELIAPIAPASCVEVLLAQLQPSIVWTFSESTIHPGRCSMPR